MDAEEANVSSELASQVQPGNQHKRITVYSEQLRLDLGFKQCGQLSGRPMCKYSPLLVMCARCLSIMKDKMFTFRPLSDAQPSLPTVRHYVMSY